MLPIAFMQTSIGAWSKRKARGFTFVELLIAMGVLLVFAACTFAALTQFNRYAAASRLRVHALALAQQRVDEVLTTQWRVSAARPEVLTVGTQTEDELIINADELNQQAGLSSTFTSLVAPVMGTRTTEITDVGDRTLRATVLVSFVYANRTYRVSMTTLRATDTI